MWRRFDGIRELILSEQHLSGDFPGEVIVMVSELADQREVVTTLLRIASWVEGEAKAAEGADSWPDGD
jgi:hypothetical protein